MRTGKGRAESPNLMELLFSGGRRVAFAVAPGTHVVAAPRAGLLDSLGRCPAFASLSAPPAAHVLSHVLTPLLFAGHWMTTLPAETTLPLTTEPPALPPPPPDDEISTSVKLRSLSVEMTVPPEV